MILHSVIAGFYLLATIYQFRTARHQTKKFDKVVMNCLGSIGVIATLFHAGYAFISTLLP